MSATDHLHLAADQLDALDAAVLACVPASRHLAENAGPIRATYHRARQSRIRARDPGPPPPPLSIEQFAEAVSRLRAAGRVAVNRIGRRELFYRAAAGERVEAPPPPPAHRVAGSKATQTSDAARVTDLLRRVYLAGMAVGEVADSSGIRDAMDGARQAYAEAFTRIVGRAPVRRDVDRFESGSAREKAGWSPQKS